jgi:hypothetical protein
MILPDINVLVYALHQDLPQHQAAKEWLQACLVGEEQVAMWDVALVSVYRIVTTPRMVSAVAEPEAALAAISRLRNAPSSVSISPGASFWTTFSSIVRTGGLKGAITSDAMLAALAIEHRCRLATFDKDFDRFPGLQWFRP